MRIASLWRYPVKSMMGEELNASEVTRHGLLGDRIYGVIDQETGKLANAKNPKKWPNMFSYRASFTEPIELSKPMPPIRITLPTGETVVSTASDLNERLSASFHRDVALSSPSSATVEFEGYVPENVEGMENPGSVFSVAAPIETFFDIGMVHIVTTSTIDMLRKLAPTSRIEARRFRPNIIIDTKGKEGFVEEEWVERVMSIGEQVQLKITQPTRRCIMTTLAQGDLPDDLNILQTLAKENERNFGVYAEVIRTGKIQVGDKVEIS